MNHHNKRDTQTLKSKIAEIRHYNKSLFLSLTHLFNIDIKDIYITLTESSITISHNFEYTKYFLKSLLKISNTRFTKASIVLCDNITIQSLSHQLNANWKIMAQENNYVANFTENIHTMEFSTTITLANLTFDITPDFIIELRRYFLSYNQNNTYNIHLTYDLLDYNKSDIIKTHIDPIQFDKAYYKYSYSVYSDSNTSYIKNTNNSQLRTIREKQTKHYKSYFLNKIDYPMKDKTHIYDISVALLNDILLEEEEEIYGSWESRKGVYFYRNGIALNTEPILCCLNDYKGEFHGKGVRIRVDIYDNLDEEFGIKSIKSIQQDIYDKLNNIIKQPIAFACYKAHMKYENITSKNKLITLDDVDEITRITHDILSPVNTISSITKLRHSNVYNKIDGENEIKLNLEYANEENKPDRQKKIFQQLNMLKYATLPDDVLDKFEEIIGIYGL